MHEAGRECGNSQQKALTHSMGLARTVQTRSSQATDTNKDHNRSLQSTHI